MDYEMGSNMELMLLSLLLTCLFASVFDVFSAIGISWILLVWAWAFSLWFFVSPFFWAVPFLLLDRSSSNKGTQPTAGRTQTPKTDRVSIPASVIWGVPFLQGLITCLLLSAAVLFFGRMFAVLTNRLPPDNSPKALLTMVLTNFWRTRYLFGQILITFASLQIMVEVDLLTLPQTSKKR